MAFALAGFFMNAGNVVIVGRNIPQADGDRVVLLNVSGYFSQMIGNAEVTGGEFRLEADFDDDEPVLMELVCPVEGVGSLRRELSVRSDAYIEVDGSTDLIPLMAVKSNVGEQRLLDSLLHESRGLIELQSRPRIKASAVLTDTTASDDEKRKAYAMLRQLEKSSDSLQCEVDIRYARALMELPHSSLWFDRLVAMSRRENIKSDSLRRSLLTGMYNTLDHDERGSDIGQMVSTFLFPPVIIEQGDTVPSTVFYDIDGRKHSLAEFAGKWILLDFWSGSCGPCIASFPELSAVAAERADSLAVVSLSIDIEDAWVEASKRHGLTGNNWNEKMVDAGIFQKFGFRPVPDYVLIAPDGTVRRKWTGYMQGHIRRNLHQLMDRRPQAKVSIKDNHRIITNPAYESNNTEGILEIEEIDVNDKSTVLTLLLDYAKDRPYIISDKVKLIAPDGTEYSLSGADGIELNKHNWIHEEGNARFRLVFPALAPGTGSIDFVSGRNSATGISGIKLN